MARSRPRDPGGTEPAEQEPQSESAVTVLVALVANGLIAAAKTVAAMLTGSASMVAESAHSWADTGNEVFLFLATRRASRKPDESHPLGYGRDAYVWSMIAAFGLFAVGAAVSIMHGVQELLDPEPSEGFVVAYVVLAISFVLEGVSFAQAFRQARREAAEREKDLFSFVLHTSDPTVRAVFFEDAAALTGIVIAFLGILGHQLTGSPVPDAVGSILVGVLLGVVAIVLIQRNRRFLVGEEVDPVIRSAALTTLLSRPAISAVTYLHIEYAGPSRVFLVAAVDLTGDDSEHDAAVRLGELQRDIERNPRVVRAVLTLAAPEHAPLTP
ncbi:cation diffusion facilitator family transporter [Naasia sp. SYSU D00057]|uniref:cation diffusion facilitator family transporter n=1 Tax=Naasia sp. SYSU D00057 TaxID=2817380 RepID=UPI001B306765|nr:cation diffusion facilitator family transporter [Naasia sp. SYSU D00057]